MSNQKGKTYEEIYGKERADEIKLKQSLKSKGIKKSEEHKSKLSKAQKESYKNGRELSGICNIQGRNYSEVNRVWNRGKTKETDERVKKISEKIKKTENSEEWINTIGKNKSYKLSIHRKGRSSWNKDLNKHNSEKIKSIGLKISETWKLKSDDEKEKFRKLQRDITVKRLNNYKNRKFYDTKPEIKFKEFLNRMSISYFHSFPILDIYHSYLCDFFIPEFNLIIEVDGKYFHNFPDGREIDIIREKEILEKGYFIFRVWEDMIDYIDENIFLEFLDNIKMENLSCPG